MLKLQDRHEVVLEANITRFKQKMKEAVSTSKSAGEQIANYTKIDISKN